MRCSAFGRRVFDGVPGALAVLLLLVVSLHPGPGYPFPGDLDPSFGTKGVVITDFGAGSDAAFALVRQSDGRLVAAGRSTTGGSADFALARYNTDGSLDPAFGTAGEVRTDFGGNRCFGGPRHGQSCKSHDDCLGGQCISSDDVAWALALESDGKLLAAGERRACVGGTNDRERCQVDSDCGGTPPGVCLADFALARYDADGSLDLSFGSGGRVVTDFGGDDEAFAVAVQSDGKIVVAGERRVCVGGTNNGRGCQADSDCGNNPPASASPTSPSPATGAMASSTRASAPAGRCSPISAGRTRRSVWSSSPRGGSARRACPQPPAAWIWRSGGTRPRAGWMRTSARAGRWSQISAPSSSAILPAVRRRAVISTEPTWPSRWRSRATASSWRRASRAAISRLPATIRTGALIRPSGRAAGWSPTSPATTRRPRPS